MDWFPLGLAILMVFVLAYVMYELDKPTEDGDDGSFEA